MEVGECKSCGAGSSHLKAGKCFYCSGDDKALIELVRAIEESRKPSIWMRILSLFS